jgi:hypothetical protein
MLPESDLATVDASWRTGGKGYGEYKKTLLAAYHATFGRGARPVPGAAEGSRARWTPSSERGPSGPGGSPLR